MPFRIRMGLPEMEAHWSDLSTRKLAGMLDRDGRVALSRLPAGKPKPPGKR